MKIKTALERIKWRIKSGFWFSNTVDIEAYNTLVDLVDNKNHKIMTKNKIVYRLYVYCFLINLKLQGLTFLNKISQKEFHKSLERPIELIINDITTNLNDMEQLSFFYELQLPLAHLPIKDRFNKTKTDSSKSDSGKIEFAIKTPNKFNQYFGCTWTPEEVEKNIEDQFIAFLEVIGK